MDTEISEERPSSVVSSTKLCPADASVSPLDLAISYDSGTIT